MAKSVVILGGGPGGMAVGISLARQGWEATIVERDPPPPDCNGDEAFSQWDRPHVPQWRQPHGFSSRARNLLLEHIPEVIDRLLADGVEEVNFFKLLAPEDMWSPEDDEYTMLWSRRPAFELAVRHVAEAQDGLRFLCPARVVDLQFEDSAAVPTVNGLVLDDGTSLAADVVIDAGGRRTPVPKWLGTRGVDVPMDVQECSGNYYSRYYRLHPDSGLNQLMLVGQNVQLERAGIVGFTGDHDTFGIGVFPLREADEFKVLRNEWAWDAFFEAIPRWRAWTDPANATPLTSPAFMTAQENALRHYVVDGEPLVHGLLPVGDSLCCTNPQYGWGTSMALTYAFAAVAAITAHTDDPRAMACAYHDAITQEAGVVYQESAAQDRMQLRRWRDEPTPPEEEAAEERQDLLNAVIAGATHHPALGRAQLRRAGLLPGWNRVLEDPEVLEQARNTQSILAAKADRKTGPTTAELLELVEAARP